MDAAVGSCGKGREVLTGDPCEAGVTVSASRREQGSPACARVGGSRKSRAVSAHTIVSPALFLLQFIFINNNARSS